VVILLSTIVSISFSLINFSAVVVFVVGTVSVAVVIVVQVVMDAVVAVEKRCMLLDGYNGWVLTLDVPPFVFISFPPIIFQQLIRLNWHSRWRAGSKVNSQAHQRL